MQDSTPRDPARTAGHLRPRGGSRRAGRLLALVLMISGVASPWLRAETNLTPASRYLLIFDTSAAMKRRSENVQRVAGDLLYSGMHGQMRAGDTVGVWTFNETLQTGGLPLLRWAPERRAALAARVAEFVRTQKFERVSTVAAVMPMLQRVVTNSAKLTVLIFSEGTSQFTGTPFDDAINAAYLPFRETQKQERMPFVTVLRAKDREYLGYAVTPAPWAVEFPKFPPEPVVEVPKVEPKPEPVRPAVPPLIVIGKPNPNTNTAPAVVLPQPGKQPEPEPAPGLTEAEKRFAALAAEQGVELPAGFGANPAPGISNSPLEPPVRGPTVPVEPAKEPEASKPAPPPPEKKPVAPTAPGPVTAPGNTQAVATAPVSGPTMAVAVVPGKQPVSRLLLLAGGGSVVFVALGVVYALVRRRQRAHVSLITRSMDRHNK